MFSDQFFVDFTGRNPHPNAPVAVLASPPPELADHRSSLEQDAGASQRSSATTRGWQGAFRAALDAAATVGEAVSRTAASAAEVLADRDLRRKGAAIMMAEASTRLKGIQRGIATGANTLSKGLGMVNRRQLQVVLGRIERQIADYQRSKQLLQYRKQPVDVQIGSMLYESMPQELRMRLWWVLLENPSLVELLRPIQCRSQMSSPSKVSLQAQTGSEVIAAIDAAALGLTPREHAPVTDVSSGGAPVSLSSNDVTTAAVGASTALHVNNTESSLHEVSAGTDTPALATLPGAVHSAAVAGEASATPIVSTPTSTAAGTLEAGSDSYVPPIPIFADGLLDLAPAAPAVSECPSTPPHGGGGGGALQLNDTFLTRRGNSLGSPSLSLGSTASVSHRSHQTPVSAHPPAANQGTSSINASSSVAGHIAVPGSPPAHGGSTCGGAAPSAAPSPPAAARPLSALLQRLTSRTQIALGGSNSSAQADTTCVGGGSTPQSPPNGATDVLPQPHAAQDTRSFMQRAISTRSSDNSGAASDDNDGSIGCTSGGGQATGGPTESVSAAASSSLPLVAGGGGGSTSIGRLLSPAMQLVMTRTTSSRGPTASGGSSSGEGLDSATATTTTSAPLGGGLGAALGWGGARPRISTSARSSMDEDRTADVVLGRPSLGGVGGNSNAGSNGGGRGEQREGGGRRSRRMSAVGGRRGEGIASDGTNATDEWEMVAGDGPDSGDASEAVLMIMRGLAAQGATLSDSSASEPETQARQALFEAMLQVPWDSETGMVPAAFPDDCRFAMLNEMTAGQEEIDEIINRDINRTFPEHPFFGLEHGQQALFRVLKAYSLHDLETGYCQGMAFAAGVLLMYMPEEPAFRLYCRLMDPEGPNLRRMYLPGLDALKAELAVFEHLVAQRLPDLFEHLQAFGVPPVLYTSQWLMTVFATPFPPSFCARVIDIMLQDNDDRLLQRIALAIMEELQAGLLQLHDFEALITHLKVEPLQWGPQMIRSIFDSAIHSPISNAMLADAHAVAAAEMAKLGRNTSSGWGATMAGGDGGGRHRTRRSSRHLVTAGTDAAMAVDGDPISSASAAVDPSAGLSLNGVPQTTHAMAGASAAAPELAGLDGVGGLDLDLEYMNMVLELGLQGLEGQDDDTLAADALVAGQCVR